MWVLIYEYISFVRIHLLSVSLCCFLVLLISFSLSIFFFYFLQKNPLGRWFFLHILNGSQWVLLWIVLLGCSLIYVFFFLSVGGHITLFHTCWPWVELFHHHRNYWYWAVSLSDVFLSHGGNAYGPIMIGTSDNFNLVGTLSYLTVYIYVALPPHSLHPIQELWPLHTLWF